MSKKSTTSITWTKSQARLFQLYVAGLHGKSYPEGDEGIRACFDDLDVLQIDALPILGRNHDLVMQARVDGIHPDQTLDLLHRERLGFEYWDKVFCAIPTRHFPEFRAFMAAGGGTWGQRREAEIEKQSPGSIEHVYQTVKKEGPLSSRELKDLGVAQKESRGWKSTKVANGALDSLWNRGRIGTSHRQSFRKYFDLIERVIPKKYFDKSTPTLETLWAYWLKKRVSNVGLLPMKGDAEAWALLGHTRSSGVVDQLIRNGELMRVKIQGIKMQFLAPIDAEALLKKAQASDFDGRACFIAPLDQLIWCRQTVSKLWNFDYVWEVYKPVEKRRWGYYVLPVLYQDKFVARFDGKFDRKTGVFHVLAYHPEPGGLAHTHEAVESAFQRFQTYLGAEKIIVKKPRKPKKSKK